MEDVVAFLQYLDSTQLPNGNFLYYGRKLMSTYPGSEHTRSAEFRLPAKLLGIDPRAEEGCPSPVINATVYTLDSNAGTIFAIYGMVLNLLGDETQVVIGAQNTVLDQKSDKDFYCSLTVIGTPLP